jgi:hypothetical protein
MSTTTNLPGNVVDLSGATVDLSGVSLRSALDLSGNTVDLSGTTVRTVKPAPVVSSKGSCCLPSSKSESTTPVAKAPSQHVEQFVQVVLANVTKTPKSGAEAVALFKYLLKSDVEPLLESLLEGLIEKLPSNEQKLARSALKLGEVVIKRCLA